MERISKDAIHAVYDVSRKIRFGEITNKKALDQLEREFALNRNSGADYIQNYFCMIEGRRFTRTLNAYGTQYYLTNILEDDGRTVLKKAVSSVGKHIPYYEKTRNVNLKKQRAIYAHFLPIANLEEPIENTPRHFMQYWKAKQVDTELASKSPLLHSGSEQLDKVSPGDILWIVTVRHPGHLHLIGPIHVGKIVSLQEAKRQFGANVWDATYHVIAENGFEEPIREMSLMSIAADLRFISSKNRDRLTVKWAKVDGKQLQTIRRLEIDSAKLLEKMWSMDNVSAEGNKVAIEFEEQVRRGAGFGDPVENKKVERAAIDHVTKDYQLRGWAVESVEPEKRGFDLRCTKGPIEEHVEVKGVRGREVSFIITRGEIKRAKNDSDFVLCVVTSALTNQCKCWSYRRKEFLQEFICEPLAYRATRIR